MSITWFPERNRWRIEITRQGQRIRKYAEAGSTKAEAQQLEAQIIRDLWLNKLGKKADRTLEEAFEKWADEIMPTLNAEAKNHAWHLLPYIKGRKLVDAPLVAEDYIKKNRALSASTIRNRLSILKRICNLAFKNWGWLDAPVAEKISMPSVNNARHIFLTYEQVLALLVAADTKYTEDAILMAVYSGMRLSEILRAEARDDTLYLWTSKNKDPRVVPMHDVLSYVDFPFAVKKSTVQKHFRRARDAAGLPDVHFHDLRHTTASWLVQKGVPLYSVGTLLGHRSTKTTQRYAHLATDHLREVVGKL